MSSSTMREPLAIRLQNVSKIYKLHGSQSDQLIEVLGLQRFGIRTKTPSKEFAALSDISLDVLRGHRVGIVGRNGAGKTTLLKLICGNFAPTSGEVEVNGTVQALMNIGLGFHPEYTGRENVEASLQYNGLARDEYENAMEGIIDFCELGDFLDQPFKTYSLGMQARLMFAAATAIRPDILIVDEVLGAGDAYFVAKSKSRVERLVGSGCTMLLVSHSMQQVLELCEEVIWLDKGEIRMRGEALLVVKAYEEYLHGPIASVSLPADIEIPKLFDEDNESVENVENLEQGILDLSTAREHVNSYNSLLQEPSFRPHGHNPNLPAHREIGLNFEAPGGISRWNSDIGVKVVGFSTVTRKGLSNTLIALQPAKFVIHLIAENDGKFECCYGVAINDHSGRCIARIFSPCDKFEIKKGGLRRVEMLLNPCQVGPGEYTVGISVTEYSGIEKINNAKRFDLLSRSFLINVELPDSYSAASASFFHSAEWNFSEESKI